MPHPHQDTPGHLWRTGDKLTLPWVACSDFPCPGILPSRGTELLCPEGPANFSAMSRLEDEDWSGALLKGGSHTYVIAMSSFKGSIPGVENGPLLSCPSVLPSCDLPQHLLLWIVAPIWPSVS